MTYGYIRVSTDDQDCQNQKIGINDLATRLGLQVERWIEDQGVSGMKEVKKRNLGKLMKMLKPGDHLLVSEISRLGRELFMIFEILKHFSEKGIKLNTVKDNYVLDGSITSKVLAFAFGMAANIERDMISKRTLEGLAARRKAGVVFGRPLGAKSAKKKLDDKEALIKKYISAGLTYNAIAKLLRVHRHTVAVICKERGWEKGYSEARKEVLKGYIIKNTGKPKDLKISIKDILDLYEEHKSLEKVAKSFCCCTTTLKNYIVRKGWWERLQDLDDRLRLENPSINRQAKVYTKNF